MILRKKGNELKNNSKLFRNKRAMELQINFIVMLIIAIVIFGLGIKISTKIFTDAAELKDSLDKKAESEILNHLNSGKVISIGLNRKEINTGETDTFALGLINKYGKPIDIIVLVKEGFIAVDNNNKPIDTEILEGYEIDRVEAWTFKSRGPFALKDNEKRAIPLAFRVPKKAPKGLYSFTVEVRYADNIPEAPSYTASSATDIFNNQVLKVYIEVNK